MLNISPYGMLNITVKHYWDKYSQRTLYIGDGCANENYVITFTKADGFVCLTFNTDVM